MFAYPPPLLQCTDMTALLYTHSLLRLHYTYPDKYTQYFSVFFLLHLKSENLQNIFKTTENCEF